MTCAGNLRCLGGEGDAQNDKNWIFQKPFLFCSPIGSQERTLNIVSLTYQANVVRRGSKQAGLALALSLAFSVGVWFYELVQGFMTVEAALHPLHPAVCCCWLRLIACLPPGASTVVCRLLRGALRFTQAEWGISRSWTFPGCNLFIERIERVRTSKGPSEASPRFRQQASLSLSWILHSTQASKTC